MAFIGTPLDTRNTFQSLVGKRFNGDGSTTAFTLDVAPSSVLDIEVFVGNVRQDPNSAYTLSGTTLTFTGAPPSGTNNIYVVHQAKSVGTIDPPATETIAKTFSGGVTLSGTTTHSGALNVTGGLDSRGGAVFNEGSADEDFRIEGNGEANLFYIDAGEDKIYSGIAAKSVHAAGYEPHIQIEGLGDNKNSVSLTQNSNNNGAPALIMCKTRGTAVAATTIVQDNDYLGNIMFGGADGNDRQTYGAYIIARVDGTPGENDMPTELKFGTTADGAASPTDRLVILPAGAVKATSRMIIDGDGNSSYKLNLEYGGNSESGSYMNDKDGANNATYFNFRRTGTEIGSIQRNGTNDAINFNTSSDYRLKQSEENIIDGITRIKQLKPYKFNWKSDPSGNKVDGFFAHEVQSIIPEAISGIKDATETLQKVVLSASGDVVRTNIEQADWTHGKTEEGGEIYASNTTWEATKEIIKPQGIDQAKLVPLLTAALQEAITKIETLETKVKALEE